MKQLCVGSETVRPAAACRAGVERQVVAAVQEYTGKRGGTVIKETLLGQKN